MKEIQLPKWSCAILRKHRHHYVQHCVGFGCVCCCALDKDVGGVEVDFRVVSVDDGREGEGGSFGIVKHREHRRVSNDGEELGEALVSSIKVHQLVTVHVLRLIQRYKVDRRGRQGFIRERRRHRVQIVRSNGHQRAAPSQKTNNRKLHCTNRHKP